ASLPPLTSPAHTIDPASIPRGNLILSGVRPINPTQALLLNKLIFTSRSIGLVSEAVKTGRHDR
ncbi:unnamed protein product, partial [Nesidiocoris tenuis]